MVFRHQFPGRAILCRQKIRNWRAGELTSAAGLATLWGAKDLHFRGAISSAAWHGRWLGLCAGQGQSKRISGKILAIVGQRISQRGQGEEIVDRTWDTAVTWAFACVTVCLMPTRTCDFLDGERFWLQLAATCRARLRGCHSRG